MAALAASSEFDFSRFVRRKGETSTFEVAVRGAHCANCIAKIEKGVGALDGMDSARLNLSTGKLVATWHGSAVTPQGVIARVRALGYDAYPYEAAAVASDADSEGRTLLRCLAVAGFGTVFVMGLTDGIWYGGIDMSEALRNTFFALAAMVSVPFTLYAAQPFFASAWRSLKARRTNMDVPIAAAIVLSLGLSLYETAVHGTATYFDAAIMLCFLLLIGRYLDFLLRNRARDAARHLVAMQSQLARRIKANGDVETVAAKEIAPGDRILLAAGDRAPADGRLEDATDADVSLVTGESLPVKIVKGGVLHAGSVIVGRPTVLTASARAQDSLVADLARLLEAGQQTRNLYVRLADRAARAYVPVVSILSLAVFIGWTISGAPLTLAITNAITVLIITCPCALGLAVPAVQIVATGRLFRHGMFVKSGDALERLAQVDTVILDKTGTLTFGTPVLANAIAPSDLAAAAKLARASAHPLARALAQAAGEGPVAANVHEAPGQGLEAVIDGIACKLGSAAWIGMSGESNATELWFRAGDAAPVRFVFRDRLRADAADTVAALKARCLTVEMLTGDHLEPAQAVAKEAGIETFGARVGPAEKAAHVRKLKEQGRHVLMVGDGLNDAAALALAHASIAPGTATDVSQLASDMVLRGNKLMPVVEAIDVARKARALVLENFALAALYNVIAVPLAAVGFVTPLIAAAMMASSSLMVTLNALRLAWVRR